MEWHKDYPQHTFDIVSPELPSGSAWLVNCLLELGVPVWDLWGQKKRGEWLRLAPYKYCYRHPDLPWMQTLSSLKLDRVFSFDKNLSGRASHLWPTGIPKGIKLILFVRDPRDMLFSQWRRNRFNLPGFNLGFKDFLASQYHHLPVSYVDYLRFFWSLWECASQYYDCCIVKFEDYKSDPFNALKKVLNFLNVERNDDDISRAVELSDSKVLRGVEDNLSAQGLLNRRFNFSSHSLEYKTHMSDSEMRAFGSGLNPACSWLGYELFSSKKCSNFEMSEDWKEEMFKCISGGTFDESQRKELEFLFESSKYTGVI